MLALNIIDERYLFIIYIGIPCDDIIYESHKFN